MNPKFHEVTVARRTLLSPGMIRLTFAGEALSGFRPTGIADEYLRLFFENEETGELVLPIIDEEGRWTYHEDKPPVRCATYTVRRFDAGQQELDIDFVVHEGGVASEWAQRAEPGHRIVINNPRGLYEPPQDLSWQLLMADATGIPALARLLEQIGPEVHCRVIIEVASEADMQPLPFHPAAVVTWVHGSGNGLCASRLAELFRMVPLPEGPGHIWAAAEQQPVRIIRKHVKQVLKMPPERQKLVAYWIDEETKRPEPCAALPDRILAELAADWGGPESPAKS